MSGPRILITGANGFAGHHLATVLAGKSQYLTLAVRGTSQSDIAGARIVQTGSIDGRTNWNDALKDVTAIVHCAAHVHSGDQKSADTSAFTRVNVDGTRALLSAADRAGVATIINLSTISVYPPELGKTSAISESEPCAPVDPYGQSKHAAEDLIAQFASETRSALNLRLPMIHGPGARGNWQRLCKIASLPIPPPSIASRNRRSVIGIHNLCDAVARALEVARQRAISGAFNVTDAGYVSTDDLVRWIREGLGKNASVIPGTSAIWSMAAKGLGRQQAYERFVETRLIDGRKFCTEFQWQPPLTTRDAIIKDHSK